jgi:hypothetical protein
VAHGGPRTGAARSAPRHDETPTSIAPTARTRSGSATCNDAYQSRIRAERNSNPREARHRAPLARLSEIEAILRAFDVLEVAGALTLEERVLQRDPRLGLTQT